MSPIVDLIRRLVVGNERVLAQRAMRRLEPPDVDRRRFEKALAGPGRPGDIVIGRVRRANGRWATVRLPAETLCRLHLAVAGASGSGKSRWLTGVLLQLILWGKACVIFFDAKSETARDLREVIVPYVIAETGDESILQRLRVINPFDPAVTAPLNLTQREEGLSVETQAFTIVASIEEALAESLSPRSRPVMLRLVSAAISIGAPLPHIQDWLADQTRFARAAMRSPDPSIREYARNGFPRENRESLRAIAARLNAFLFLPETKRALTASSCVRFADLDQPGGLSIIDVGSPPAGSEHLMRFWGGPLVGMLTRGALSRTVTPTTVPMIIVLEEIQEVIGAQEARSLARLLSVARFRSVAVWTTSQARAQLLKVDRNLVEAISTNAGLQVQFRASLADAQAFAHLLPDRAGTSSRTSGRRDQIEELTRLRRRRCYLALRDAPFRARLVVAPRLDLDALRQKVDGLPADVRNRVAQAGTIAGREPVEDVVIAEEPTVKPPDRPKPKPEEPGSFPALG